MPISISCTNCNSKYKLRDSLAGKRIACPKCQAVISVPATQSIAKPAPNVNDNLDSWGIPSFDQSSPSESNSNFDPFGLPEMQLPPTTSAPVAPQPAPIINNSAPAAKQPASPAKQQSSPTKQTTQHPNQQAQQAPAETKSIRTSTYLLAGGTGFLVILLVIGLGIVAIKASIGTNEAPQVAAPEIQAQNVITNAAETKSLSKPKTPSEATRPSNAPIASVPVVAAPTNAAESNASSQPNQQTISKKPTKTPPAVPSQRNDANTQFPQTSDGKPDEAQYLAINSAIAVVKVSSKTESKLATGFLIDTSPNGGYIVTSANAVSPNSTLASEISCVFFSGTENEFTVAAQLAGKDDTLDLAILRVQHDKLPSAISIDRDTKLSLKEQVYFIGFPENGNDTSNATLSNTTLSIHSITDLKTDDFDFPYIAQIDRPFDSSGSGSPVFARDGRLLGVVVSKKPFDDQQTYFIPRSALGDVFNGRVMQVSKRKLKDTSKPSYEIQMELIDPQDSIESISIYSFDYADQSKRSPDKNGKWELASERILSQTQCQITMKTALANYAVPADANQVMLQYRVKRKGSEWFSEPTPLSSGANTTTSIARTVFSKPSNESSSTPPSESAGDSRLVKLQSDFADFVIHPTNGDIVGVDPVLNEAVLFQAANYGDKEATPKKVDVGITPISIAYKKFAGKEYYAVVCSQESNMYLIDAKEFTLAEKIPLMPETISFVSASKNENDPYIYFGHYNTPIRYTGAINLRNSKVTPQVFSTSMFCQLSADGTRVHIQSSLDADRWTVAIIDSFEDDVPVFGFQPIVYDLGVNVATDNLGECIAFGNSIYTPDAKTHLAKLDFTPYCFAQWRAMIVGLDKMVLRVGSMNSLTPYDRGISIPFSEATLKQANLASAKDDYADRRVDSYQTKVLLDEPNDRVIVARRDSLFVVPLDTFGLPHEPLLALEVSPKQLRVATPQKITVKPVAEGTEVTYDKLPEGATAVADGIEWKPTNNQIGKVKIVATLKNGDVTRNVDCDLTVEHPNSRMPFNISNFDIIEKDAVAVCWSSEAKLSDKYSNAPGGEVSETPTPRIAATSLNGSSTLETISNTYPAMQVLTVGSRIAVQFANDRTKLEVYEYPGMKRVKVIITSSNFETATIQGDYLLLPVGAKSEYYNVSNLKLAQAPNESAAASKNPINGQLKDGMIVRGILVDQIQQTPKLILEPTFLRDISGADYSLVSGAFLRQTSTKKTPIPTTPTAKDNLNQTRIRGPIPVPKTGWNIELHEELKHTPKLSTRDAAEDRHRVFIRFVATKSDQTEDVVLIDEPVFVRRSPIPKAQFKISDGDVFVSCGNRLYRCKVDIPKLAPGAKEKISDELYFEPQQSSFIVKGTKATLKHVVHGGQAPFEFAILRSPEWATLDEANGQVTLDLDKIAETTQREILNPIVSSTPNIDDKMEKLKPISKEIGEAITSRFKTKTQGYPVAVPIHLKVVDEPGRVAEIQYFVIVDLSVRQVRKALLQK